jgi:hypothetical protein
MINQRVCRILKHLDGAVVVRGLLLIVALMLMVGGFVLAYRGDAPAAATIYVAAVFCLVFAFLSQFKKFSGLGFAGETWEQKMQEADELISRLRGLAAVIAEPVFIAMARLGRWDSHLTRQERYDISTKLEAELSRNGVYREDIDQARKELDRVNTFDMAKPLFDAVYRKIQEKVDERRRAVDAFPQPITAQDEHATAAQQWLEATKAQLMFARMDRIKPFTTLPNVFLERLTTRPVLTHEERIALREQCREEIDDLQYYVQHRQFRRLDVWLRGEG